MKKLLIFTPTLDQYGSARTLRAIIERCDSANLASIEIWFPPDVQRNYVLFPDSLNSKYVEFDFPILRRRYIRSLRIFQFYSRGFRNVYTMRKTIRKEKIDVYVHTFTLASIFAAMIAPKKKRQISIHEVPNGRFEKWILIKFVRILFPNVIFASNYLKETYELQGVTIHSGADVEKYLNIPFVQLRKNETIQILCIGRFNYWKGQHIAIEAASILKSLDTSFQMTFIGSGFANNTYLTYCQEFVKNHHLGDHIKFLGEVNDISKLLKPVHFLLLPSIKPEPFGKVVVEGMAAGKVVIATQLGGPSEVIVDGVSGALVENASPRKLADKILEYLANPSHYKSVSEQARIRSRDFSEGNMSAQYFESFQKLIR